jgi:hypothetical protein
LLERRLPTGKEPSASTVRSGATDATDRERRFGELSVGEEGD